MALRDEIRKAIAETNAEGLVHHADVENTLLYVRALIKRGVLVAAK